MSGKNLLFLTFFGAFILNVSKAQQCGNCKETPKLALFDFDVQVPKPNAADGTDNLWPEWKNLFILAGSVSSALAKNEGSCIKFMVVPSVDTTGHEGASVGGETFTNLPTNPNISSDLSLYGDYILTGTIKQSGAGLVLHVEVQTACGRQVIAKTDVAFQLSGVVMNVSNLAQQAANQLSPLGDKIKKFELEERQKNKSLSLYKVSPGEPMKVTPDKKMLKPGESTGFTIELKDCDGVPLSGREIRFNEASFNGFKIHGTIGGTVTPVMITTDANGKARATFTLKTGAKEAFIAAHSPGKDVKGCESMFFGDAPINIKYTYSGYVKYSYESSSNCREDTSAGCLRSIYQGYQKQKISYAGSFYVDQEKSETVDLLISENGESNGLVPDKMDAGSYSYDKKEIRKGIIICESVSKGQTTVQEITQLQEGDLKAGGVRFSLYDNSGHVSLNLVFKTEGSYKFSQTYLPSQQGTSSEDFDWSIAFDSLLDKDFTIKKEKSGSRTKYTIEGKRGVTTKCSGTVETLTMVVYEE